MSFINCLDNVVHNWVLGLPENPEGRNIYFVKTSEGVLMYVTDGQGIPYLIGGGGSEPITLTSPNNTISIINETEIDISPELVAAIEGIISLHNSFPDLQGGSENEYFHLNNTQYNYVSQMVSEDKIQNLYDLINLLATHPTYIPPTSSLTGSIGTYEVGASVGINITQTFTQNDGGAEQSEEILKNNSVVSTTNNFTETLTVPLGNTVYSGKVNYAQGACKLNNLNVIDCTGRIEAGETTSPNRIIVGGFRRFAGNVSNFPVGGTELRTELLGSSVVNTSNSFSFTTGTTNRRFVIAIPSSKNLVSVINSGTNENLDFILSGSITTVPDAAGTDQNYKVYTLENAVPFSNNYIINVTLS